PKIEKLHNIKIIYIILFLYPFHSILILLIYKLSADVVNLKYIIKTNITEQVQIAFYYTCSNTLLFTFKELI
ncbi:hypothetical protein BGH95_00085, partial [Snodgrassella alvi]